jgi:hypothetical protein
MAGRMETEIVVNGIPFTWSDYREHVGGPRRLDLPAGARVGLLEIVRAGPTQRWLLRNGDYHTSRFWICRCNCGQETIVRHEALRWTRSCGCYRRRTSGEKLKALDKDGAANPSWRHGMYGTPEYRAWANAKLRCFNPRREDYARYGGRGITMDPIFVESFEAFLKEVGFRPSPKHSLDRIDNEGHYAPGNVRWATASEQNTNQRPRTRRKR